MFLTKIDKINSLYQLLIATAKSEEDKVMLAFEYLTISIPDFENMSSEEQEELVYIVLDNFDNDNFVAEA